MEVRKCLLYFLLVVVLWSFVIAAEGDESLESQETQDCKNTTRSVVDDLTTSLRHCIHLSSSSLPQPSPSAGEEQYSSYARMFCDSVPSIRHCLATESDRWKRCYNQTLNKVFEIFREVVETTLEHTCQEQARKLSLIIHGYNQHTRDYTASNPFIRECMIFPSIKIKTAITSQAGTPSKFWYFYHEIRAFKDCLIRYIQDDDSFSTLAMDLMNHILDTMKCLHPQDESVVLCKHIDTELIDRAGLCPLKTKSELLVPRGFLLESRGLRCFHPMYDPYGAKLSDAVTPDDFREFFRKYCSRQRIVKHCLSETSLTAEVCLDEGGFEIFKLVRHYLELVLDASCFEEGRRLATVLHMAYIIRSSPTQSLVACLTETLGKRDKNVQGPARIYSYYQELPFIRDCLLSNVVGDETYQTDVNELIQKIMENMQCFNPKDRSVILCETLANNE